MTKAKYSLGHTVTDTIRQVGNDRLDEFSTDYYSPKSEEHSPASTS